MAFTHYLGDCRNSGMSDVNLRANGYGKVISTFLNYYWIDTMIATAADTLIFRVEDDGGYKTRAIDLTGTTLWEVATSAPDWGYVRHFADTTNVYRVVCNGTDLYVHGVSQSDGSDVFPETLYSALGEMTSAVLGTDGDLYVATYDGNYISSASHVHSFSTTDGTKNFSVALQQGSGANALKPEYGNLAMGTDGLIYVSAHDFNNYSSVQAIDPSAETSTEVCSYASNRIYSGVTLDSSNNIYFINSTDDKLYKVASDGTPLWTSPVLDWSWGKNPTLLSGNRVIFDGHVLSAIDGSVLYTHEVPSDYPYYWPTGNASAVSFPDGSVAIPIDGYSGHWTCLDTGYNVQWSLVNGYGGDMSNIVPLSNGGLAFVSYDSEEAVAHITYMPPSVSVTPTVTFTAE